MTYKFECWEIRFPDDPDGEPTRGIGDELAAQMIEAGLIRPLSEGIVINSYGERVFSHCYEPVPEHDGRAWRVAMDDDINAED